MDGGSGASLEKEGRESDTDYVQMEESKSYSGRSSPARYAEVVKGKERRRSSRRSADTGEGSVMKQPEPGVYITFGPHSQIPGCNELRRARFSFF
eukprot:TRINITY_DN6125_c0_g1_i1.p1 TRINITY_DN6125_c0_g1~~TRINITY_DN6125_c0_g1_i1.p1  ORF type:complete len:108 (+),score=26.89 TRINITY_DN6125_c0_g1_i1:41-325(+)